MTELDWEERVDDGVSFGAGGRLRGEYQQVDIGLGIIVAAGLGAEKDQPPYRKAVTQQTSRFLYGRSISSIESNILESATHP